MSSQFSNGEQKFQRHIIDYLVEKNGWIERKYRNYNRKHAVDYGMLTAFLRETQPKAYGILQKSFGEHAAEMVVAEYERACRASQTAQVDVFRHGVDINSTHIDLLYNKPASTLNPQLMAKYQANRLSVMEEVRIDDESRIDLVFFINGFPWAAVELKYQPAGSVWQNAVQQWINDRDPKNRLLEWQVGTIVNFAMDDQECHMTTHLEGEKTRFIPFNRGRGQGIQQGAGNPEQGSDGVDDYPTHYMWDDVLTKDSVIELLTKFVFVSRREEYDEVKDKRVIKESVVFPRYHQRDALHKLLADVYTHKSSNNYLIQHSAGSGKTYTISWLAHRLTSLHGDDGQQVFNTVIVATDRRVVDRQLQGAVKELEKTSGIVRVMDDSCGSAELADALTGNARIIVTTLQKFLYIDELAGKLSDRRFAVIIDEAHSSTAGRILASAEMALGGEGAAENEDVSDVYARLVHNHGKRENMSVFAFTATPKPRTLKLFGTVDADNPEPHAFHSYSMKQAIEEGFILDVLRNYIEYKTYYRVSKSVADDPEVQTARAKREIARFVELDNVNIAQRVEIIVEHFRNNVLGHCGLGGKEKAMVVTSSRELAVRYRQALQDYVDRHGYTDVRALVAFSGKVTLKDADAPHSNIAASRVENGWEYSENGMNGFPESQTAQRFNSNDYNVLLVANKFQVGFDQPKLCAMYIMRKLRDVDAVQTLSRLNRMIPGKTTVVLDFVNTCKDMEAAFSRYYTTTLLENTATVAQLKEVAAALDGFNVIDEDDVEKYAEIVQGAAVKKINSTQAAKAWRYVQRAKNRLMSQYSVDNQADFRAACKSFIRLYEFLSLASSFGDPEMEKKYGYVRDLVQILNTGDHGGISVKDKINVVSVSQKELGDMGTKDHAHPSNPMIKLSGASTRLVDEEQERLSEILAEVNSRVDSDMSVSKDVAVSIGLQIKNSLLNDSRLAKAAQVNSEKDFSIPYFKAGNNALYDGLNQQDAFCNEMLKDDGLAREFLSLFLADVYLQLRKGTDKEA